MSDVPRSPGEGERRHLLGRVAGAVTGRVVDVVDPNEILDHVDLDRLLARIDPDELLGRIDVNGVLDRVDVDRLLDRVDVDRLLDRVDVDRILARADVETLVGRSGVPDLVASSTSRLAGSLLDVVRRQAAGVDTLVDRVVDRILRRRPGPALVAPPALRSGAAAVTPPGGRIAVTGHYAGVPTRALALAADAAIATVSFTLLVAGLGVLESTFVDTGLSTDATRWAGVIGWLLWLFAYQWVSLCIAGRTPGKAILGLRVVRATGIPVGPGRALTRVLAIPFSGLVAGLGFLLAVVQPQHRALHDLCAGTAVVYDWGDRPAELPGPLSSYLARHAA